MVAGADDRTGVDAVRAGLARWGINAATQGCTYADILGMLVGSAVGIAKAPQVRLSKDLFLAAVAEAWDGDPDAVVAVATRTEGQPTRQPSERPKDFLDRLEAANEQRKQAIAAAVPLECGHAEGVDDRGACLVCGFGL
jgi:hypothetical protein